MSGVTVYRDARGWQCRQHTPNSRVRTLLARTLAPIAWLLERAPVTPLRRLGSDVYYFARYGQRRYRKQEKKA